MHLGKSGRHAGKANPDPIRIILYLFCLWIMIGG